MKIREILVEERVYIKQKYHTICLVESINKKIRNLSENIMPNLPQKHIWQDSVTHKDDWIKFKRALREYQMKYNDGTEYGKLKMAALPKFISESYAELREDTDKIEEIIHRAFSGCVPADQLNIGKKYDVAVVRLDNITKIVEIDVIHSQTVNSVRHRKDADEWIVSTSEGLVAPTSVKNISEQIETLYFDNTEKLDQICRYLEMIMTPHYYGWKLSIINDMDIDGATS